jgi:hypothetical protein
MAHSYKRTSLLVYIINYARKKFYFIGQKEKIKVKFFKVNLWQQKINTKIFATHELRTCDSGDSVPIGKPVSVISVLVGKLHFYKRLEELKLFLLLKVGPKSSQHLIFLSNECVQ